MTINYYLDTNQKTQQVERILFAYVRGLSPGKTLKIHTGERIDPKHWDSAKQQVRRSYGGSGELNSLLSRRADEMRRIYRTVVSERPQTTYEDIQSALRRVFVVETNDEHLQTFFTAYEDFIESKKLSYQLNSLNKHKTILQHLRDFSAAHKYELSFASITHGFYDKFTSYMLRDRRLTNNTYGKYVTALKTFMNWASERGLCASLDFRKFKVPTEQVEIVYLTEEELLRLFNHDFSDNKTFDKVRDVFCFQCFTGQRFSDAKIFEHEDIKNGVWHLRTTKTKDIISIPLSSPARKLIEKYNGVGKMPVISSQKTNRYLKEICKEAGIDEVVTLVRYRGADRIEYTEPKHNFVSTHTARRTFVTLSLEKGMRPETVMKVTGHKDYKTFKKYIKLTDKVAAQEMKAVWG